jgi:predicted TPR repeat methyltransferase
MKEFPRELEIKLEAELPDTKKKATELEYMGEGALAPCTGKQRSFVHGLLNQLNEDLDDYGVDDLKDLTITEISVLIDELKEKRDEMNWENNRENNRSWSRW